MISTQVLPFYIPDTLPKVSADGPVPGNDCSTLYPSWYNGYNCFIRGIFNAYNINGYTHRIIYSTGEVFYFTTSYQPYTSLTGREVIINVTFTDSTNYIINEFVTYEQYNVAPNQPNLISPQSNWELGPRTNGNFNNISCDLSGQGLGCKVTFSLSANDPDQTPPLTTYNEIRSSTNSNMDQVINGQGNRTFNRNLTDGNWSWRARSVDGYNASSGFTSYRNNIIVDTTAPSRPEIINLQEFSAGIQTEIVSTLSLDNLIGGVQYYFESSLDSGFSNVHQSSGWVDSNSFIFTDLEDNTTYFYRVKSRDSLYNETNYSSVYESTQDSTLPVISNTILNTQRISPQNQDGINDYSLLTFDWSERYPSQILINIKDISENIVNSYVEDISNSEESAHFELQINGQDNNGEYLIDGAYTVEINIADKAGNIFTNSENILIIDNEPASISISNPVSGSWFNQNNITIYGQTEIDALVEFINLNSGQSIEVGLDNAGLFNIDQFIQDGVNNFRIEVNDQVGNTSSEILEYFVETEKPIVEIVNESALTNNRQREIILNLSDYGFQSGGNDYISGIDINSLQLYLKHSNSEEQQIVTNGQSLADLGNLTHNCINSNTMGNNYTANCSVVFEFTHDLVPDGNYTIRAEVKDIAGNVSDEVVTSFELDSNTFFEVDSHTDNMLLNQSLISLTGRAERGSNLNIISEDIDADGVYEDVGFNIEPQNNNRIRVFDCIPTDNNTTNGIEEICTWEVSNFQLDRDSENNIDVITNLSFNLSDSAGNTIEKNLSLNVNLFRVSLHSKTNSIYFSPNGDGKADGIEFYDIDTDGQILMYKLSILDIHLNEVRSFEGYGTPPTNILWDGKDYNNNFVEDGQYTYSLSIQTLDGVEIITDPVSLFAVTELSDSVVIINPGDDSYTTRGVTTVIGQAPANTLVTVCSNVIGLSGECNIEETVYSNNHGVFSLIFPLLRLPDQNITEHYISAYATDEFSNNTNVSNIVKISVTNQNPFNEISITPVFTGVNSPDDYQIIIDKINRNEEITLDDINSLRTVRFRSNVAQGTERVKFFYSNLTNLELLPDEVSSEYIGFIDGQNITRLYQEFTDGVTNYQNCNSSSCTWDMYYPVPYGLGGLIEISFEGKLGTTIQTLSSPLIIDSNIPTAPMILDIKKLESNQWVNTNKSNNTYFSNSNNVIVYGISDPSAIIEIVDQNNNLLCSTTSSSVGLFTCEIEYTEETTSHLNVIATLDQNSQSSLNSETLIIDTTAPEVVQVNTSTFWRNSGDIVDIEVIASEELRNTLHADYSNLICANNDIQNGAVRFLPIQDSKEKAIGSFTVSGNAVNGRYCSTLLITDLAGNQTLENYVLFIDNEKPDKPIIDSEDWGIFNGMNAKKDFISKGRLNPEFVTNDRIITLRAFGEQNQTAELFVNGKLHSQKSIEGGICYASKDQNYQDLLTDLEFDSVVVENQYQCNVDFKFTFPSETGFEFQIKVKDIAGNYSGISDNKVIYFDKTKPETPSTFSVSSQGNIINDWNAALNQDIIASTLGTGNYGKLPITNRRNIEIKDLAEALSDIEYIRESPSGRKSTTIQQKSGSGFDDRVETLSEDGIYTFTSTSWDAAGNKSNVHKFQIELDTIKPNKPELGNVYICGSNLCIDAKGEDGAFINVNGVDFDRVSITQSKSLVILSNWKYNTKYEFNVGIADRAGNISDTEFKTFYIPAGIGGGGSSNNPSAAYKNAKAWVTIGRDGNASLDWFEHVPAPVLTTPIVDFGTKDVTINGSSIPSGYVYDVDVTIKKEFNFVEENTVFSKCGYPSIFFSPDPECVKDLIGEAEYNRRESVYNSCKIYTVLNPILYTFCKMNGIYNEEMVLSETFNETTTLGISKSLVNLYKNNAQLSVIDGKDKDGHFSQVFNSGGGNNNLTEGDKVKAKLFLNGSMEIDFDNNKYTLQLGSDSKGWESGFSNEVVVGKEPEFRDLSVDPLNNCGCNVKISNRFIAITNENSTIISHNGVDFAVPEGSRIDSAGPGVVEYVGWGNGGQGYYITIRHINGTWANYLHGNGDFFVKAGDNVSAGQHIMNSGNSGNSSGPHLHFEYWLSKPWSYIYPNATGSVNPYLYLNLNNYEKLYE